METNNNSTQAPGQSADILKRIHKNEESSNKIDDILDDDAMGAAAGLDAMEAVADVDDDADSLLFMLGLALAGVLLAGIGIWTADGETGIVVGASIFLAGYAVLMIRIMPIFLIIAGLVVAFHGQVGPGLACVGIGALCLVTRYMVPRDVMALIKKISWVLMLVGPGIMLAGGASITGTGCYVVAGLWGAYFLIGHVLGKAADAAGNAIAKAIDKK